MLGEEPVSVDSEELELRQFEQDVGVPWCGQRVPRVREQAPESKNANQEIGVPGVQAQYDPIRIIEEELSIVHRKCDADSRVEKNFARLRSDRPPTTSSPVRREFGRTFCRRDRRVPCGLAATPL